MIAGSDVVSAQEWTQGLLLASEHLPEMLLVQRQTGILVMPLSSSCSSVYAETALKLFYSGSLVERVAPVR